MICKYALMVSVLVVLGTPLPARAQTMDITMKIQSILDQFSEIRSELKQVQSSANIKSMMNNLKGSGDWKNKLKEGGSVFNKDPKEDAEKQSAMALPDDLADKADDHDATVNWVKDNMYSKVENPTPEQRDEMIRKQNEFKFAAWLTAYGKALVIRRKLDKDIETIEKLRQDAQNMNSETDLQNEINKLALLKMEQTNYRQLLAASRSQVIATMGLMPKDRKDAERLSEK